MQVGIGLVQLNTHLWLQLAFDWLLMLHQNASYELQGEAGSAPQRPPELWCAKEAAKEAMVEEKTFDGKI